MPPRWAARTCRGAWGPAPSWPQAPEGPPAAARAPPGHGSARPRGLCRPRESGGRVGARPWVLVNTMQQQKGCEGGADTHAPEGSSHYGGGCPCTRGEVAGPRNQVQLQTHASDLGDTMGSVDSVAAAKGPHPSMPTRAVVIVRRAHAVCSCPRSCEMAMLHLVAGDGPSLHTHPMLRMPICETTHGGTAAYLRASWSPGPLPPLGLRRTRGADPLRER